MVDLALLLLGLGWLALLVHCIVSERPSTARYLVLHLCEAAVLRQRPIGDLLRRAAAEQPRRTRQLLLDLTAQLEAGVPLSTAMAIAPRHFPAELRAAVAAAEGSDGLAAALAGLRTTTHAGLTAGRRMQLALAYPAVLALAYAVCTQVSRPVSRLRAHYLPADGAGSAAAPWLALAWWGVLLLVLLASVAWWTADGQRRSHWRHLARMWTAWLSPGRRRLARAGYLATVASHIRGGSPLHVALGASAPTLFGSAQRRATAAARMAADGSGAADPCGMWRSAGLDPAMALRVAGAGNRHPDALAAALDDVAQNDRERLHHAQERLLQWIPLLAMLLFGALVAREFAQLMELTHLSIERIVGW